MNKERRASITAVISVIIFIAILSGCIYVESHKSTPIFISLGIGVVAGLIVMKKTDLNYFKKINLEENQKMYKEMFKNKKYPISGDQKYAKYFQIIVAVIACLGIFFKYGYLEGLWLVALLALCLIYFTALLFISFRRLYYSLSGKLSS